MTKANLGYTARRTLYGSSSILLAAHFVTPLCGRNSKDRPCIRISSTCPNIIIVHSPNSLACLTNSCSLSTLDSLSLPPHLPLLLLRPLLAQSCGQAIKAWEAKNEAIAEEADVIKLYAQIPPITKLDNSLNTLKNCEQLSLSTNSIDRISVNLNGCAKLKILALGRNAIKRIEKLEDLAETLEQLWVSYNQITTLDGLSDLRNLTTLYISNNNIKSWAELDKLSSLPALKDILLVGNPIYGDFEKREDARVEVLKHLPQLSKIDGQMVKPSEREAALGEA